MHCEGCGQIRDQLWQAGTDTEGRKTFICDFCLSVVDLMQRTSFGRTVLGA